LTSCENDRFISLEDVGYHEFAPNVVLNGLLSPDRDSSFFYLSYSKSVFETQWWYSYRNLYKNVENALVKLSINDSPYVLDYDSVKKVYIYPHRMKTGDDVAINIVDEAFSLSSSVKIPSPPEITSVDTLNGYMSAHNGTLSPIVNFKVAIEDEGIEESYYQLIVNSINGSQWGYSLSGYKLLFSNDPALYIIDNVYYTAEHSYTAEYSTAVFSSRNFKNNSYMLKFYVALDNYRPEGSVVELKLRKITWDLYKYYVSLNRSRTMGTAAIVHSNIDGGLGILGGYNEIEFFKIE
jgi:hypothetical protein